MVLLQTRVNGISRLVRLQSRPRPVETERAEPTKNGWKQLF
jgi:hypothetical protein